LQNYWIPAVASTVSAEKMSAQGFAISQTTTWTINEKFK